MKTVAVLQPSYMPWLGYFDQINRSDVFVFYDDVQYDKHGWRSRNRIKAVNGEPHWLTVPVLHTGLQKQMIKDVEITNERPWARKQIGTIRQFYAKSPHLKTYIEELSELITQPYKLLSDLNLKTTLWLCKQFQIEPETVRSSDLKIDGERTDRLIQICKHFSATHYLTGNKASEYLDVAAFEGEGIEVIWQNYEHPLYPQLHGDFSGHLSALDLLLNVGPDSHGFFARAQRPTRKISSETGMEI